MWRRVTECLFFGTISILAISFLFYTNFTIHYWIRPKNHVMFTSIVNLLHTSHNKIFSLKSCITIKKKFHLMLGNVYVKEVRVKKENSTVYQPKCYKCHKLIKLKVVDWYFKLRLNVLLFKGEKTLQGQYKNISWRFFIYWKTR